MEAVYEDNADRLSEEMKYQAKIEGLILPSDSPYDHKFVHCHRQFEQEFAGHEFFTEVGALFSHDTRVFCAEPIEHIAYNGEFHIMSDSSYILAVHNPTIHRAK